MDTNRQRSKTAWERYTEKIEIPRKVVKRNGKLVRIVDHDSCWPWTGASSYRNGKRWYGMFWLGGKNILAHRAGWQLRNGRNLATDEVVCHTCDNPPCQNPGHWFVGTVKDNNAQMYERGRHNPRHSERHGRSKLTNEQVKEIRRLYTGKYGEQAELGRLFGVNRRTIRGIVRGVEWTHLE